MTVESGVFAVEESQGSKIGPVSATYVSQGSCPSLCPFLHNGCYAENGFTGGFITKRLARGSAGTPALELARHEADAIDGLSGERDLRLHIVGDSTTAEGTQLIAAACDRYMAKHGRRVWTYTHAWRDVPRPAWGNVSVFASCETPADLVEAIGRGYAAALVVQAHPGPRLYDVGPFKILPCPEQTKGTTCAECRLCTDDKRFADAGMTIAFAVHGGRASKSAAIRSITERRRADARRVRVSG
jgi:hypothetical protein